MTVLSNIYTGMLFLLGAWSLVEGIAYITLGRNDTIQVRGRNHGVAELGRGLLTLALAIWLLGHPWGQPSSEDHKEQCAEEVGP